MTDIVDRLNGSLSVGYSELRKEAAATITRLRAKIEAAEKETASWKGLAKQFGNEADALRTKIERMEQQEPVGEIVAFGEFLHEPSWKRGKLPHLGTKLYALPGAKGE